MEFLASGLGSDGQRYFKCLIWSVVISKLLSNRQFSWSFGQNESL